jgi:replicative DNA helicase
VAAFAFDVGFQRAIIRLAMTDEAFNFKLMEYVEPEHFTTEPLGWVFTTMKRYWKTYAIRCTDVPLRESLRAVQGDKQVRYASEVENIILLGNIPEAEYVKSELGDFVKRSIFAAAHQESASLFNEGKTVAAYDLMAKAQEQIQVISFDTVDRQWFFEELGVRQGERYRRSMEPIRGFPTGIPELDKVCDGGVQPGELWCVFAYAKRCKTTWLVNQGMTSTRVRHEPVLHIVLEGHGRQIAARYDACFSQELYTNVKHGDIDLAAYRAMHEEYLRLRKLLVIRTINDWDVTVEGIAAELAHLRATGFCPAMLIVDYVDLLRSRSRTDSETQHQVNSSRDLKRLVNQEELAGWSAWQAQRPKTGADEKEHILTSANVADAYAKVRIVDAYGSLNATDAEMNEGVMRVFWEAHRDAPIRQVFKIGNSLDRMRMITWSEHYTPPKKEEKAS